MLLYCLLDRRRQQNSCWHSLNRKHFHSNDNNNVIVFRKSTPTVRRNKTAKKNTARDQHKDKFTTTPHIYLYVLFRHCWTEPYTCRFLTSPIIPELRFTKHRTLDYVTLNAILCIIDHYITSYLNCTVNIDGNSLVNCPTLVLQIDTANI